MTSFLAIMKQRLAQASVLISACGQAKVSVDASIAASENMLAKFRAAISTLDELYRQYTMQTERNVHLAHCDRFAIARPASANVLHADKADADAEDVLFF
jgi:hypothetical protein